MFRRLLVFFFVVTLAPDLAPGLRTQMTALASFVPEDLQQGEHRAVTAGIVPEEAESDPYQRMQERLDRAETAEQRDAIYADYAVALTAKGDARGTDLVDKISNSELRKNVKAYTDFQLAQLAIRKKDATEAARLAKNGELTGIQRVWAVQVAKTFTGEAPRAVATLAISRSILEKRKQG
jgi:hypothetical protein